jgi:hypothetical protein
MCGSDFFDILGPRITKSLRSLLHFGFTNVLKVKANSSAFYWKTWLLHAGDELPEPLAGNHKSTKEFLKELVELCNYLLDSDDGDDN